MTRVLLVTTVPITIEAFFEDHIQHWRDLGHEVRTVSGSGPGDHDVIPMTRRPLSPANLLAPWRMARTLRAWRPERVIATTPNAALVARLAHLLAGDRSSRRIVYLAQGFHFRRPFTSTPERAFYVIERLMAGFTDVLVTIADEDRAEVARWRRWRPQTSGRIHGIGIDVSRYPPRPPLAREEGEARVVGYVGELNDNKRVHLAIEGAAAARELVPFAVEVHVAGVGPTQDRLEGLAAELNVPVVFHGWVDDVRPLLARFDLLVLPSMREGIPRCLLEAMCIGVPCLGTPNRGTVELLGGGRGIVVEPDATLIGAAVADVLRDPPDPGPARELVAAYDIGSVEAELAALCGLGAR